MAIVYEEQVSKDGSCDHDWEYAGGNTVRHHYGYFIHKISRNFVCPKCEGRKLIILREDTNE